MGFERFEFLRKFAAGVVDVPVARQTTAELLAECLDEIERLKTKNLFESSSRFALMQGVLDGASPTRSNLEVSARTRGFTSRTPKGDAYENGFLYAEKEVGW